MDKSRILLNKTVILYPDAGCYDRWLRKAEQINHELSLHLTVSDFLENFTTPQQTLHSYDLANYLLQQKTPSPHQNPIKSQLPNIK